MRGQDRVFQGDQGRQHVVSRLGHGIRGIEHLQRGPERRQIKVRTYRGQSCGGFSRRFVLEESRQGAHDVASPAGIGRIGHPTDHIRDFRCQTGIRVSGEQFEQPEVVHLVHHAIIQQGHQGTPGGVEGIGVEVCSQTRPQGGIQFRGNRFRRDGQHHAPGVMGTQAGALQHPVDIHRGHLVPAQREAQEEHRLIVGPGELGAHDVGYRVGQRIDDGRRRDQLAVPGVAQRRQEEVHQDGVTSAKGLDHRPVNVQGVAGLRPDRVPHLLGGHRVMQQQLRFQMAEARHEIELVLGVLRGDHHLHAAVHQILDVGR